MRLNYEHYAKVILARITRGLPVFLMPTQEQKQLLNNYSKGVKKLEKRKNV